MNTSHPTWRKSSRSDNNGGACIEVASMPSTTAVRDSKHQAGPTLAFTTPTWTRFIDAIKAGERGALTPKSLG
ncbi:MULTISPECIES: DUF397 domain-containing protein [unclassified Solwaraspora]|uniref:DUF397 domain-containing protein n=1 Tax=unclassified Solwaraspora TaxID=2627926 RepID=UPI00259B7217|nr:DUF397 domain-containing protein [Solwaraspora sp. WMMA2056]WJK39520.1 DUF397 domain-containing protein [Solwaraspora sp. WMMA2056]